MKSHGFVSYLLAIMDTKQLRAEKDFGKAVQMVMEDSNFTYDRLCDNTGLSTRTLQKIIKRFGINCYIRNIYKIVLGLHPDYDTSKLLLKKAGLCKSNIPILKAYWYVLENIDDFIKIEFLGKNGEYSDTNSEKINKYLIENNVPKIYRLNTNN